MDSPIFVPTMENFNELEKVQCKPTFVVVQLLSHVQLFVTPLSAALQVPLSITVSWSLLKFVSVLLVMLSYHLIPFFFCLQSFPASGSNESALHLS